MRPRRRTTRRETRLASASRGFLVTPLGLGGVAAIYVVFGYINYAAIGGVGLLLIGAAMAHTGWQISRYGLIKRAGGLFLSDCFDEALALYDRVAHGRLLGRRLRAVAHQSAASCLVARGDHGEALVRFREAIALHELNWRKTVYYWAALCGEISTLVSLERLDEAAERLGALSSMPSGDYLVISKWTCELQLAMARGGHTIEEDVLFAWSKKALSIPSAAALLGLLAWAYTKIDDRDMAGHLLAEARARHPGPRMSNGLPRLQRWMDAGDL